MSFTIDSDSHGLVLPKVSDPTTIADQIEGMIVYNSSSDEIQIHDGTSFKNISKTGIRLITLANTCTEN